MTERKADTHAANAATADASDDPLDRLLAAVDAPTTTITTTTITQRTVTVTLTLGDAAKKPAVLPSPPMRQVCVHTGDTAGMCRYGSSCAKHFKPAAATSVDALY